MQNCGSIQKAVAQQPLFLSDCMLYRSLHHIRCMGSIFISQPKPAESDQRNHQKNYRRSCFHQSATSIFRKMASKVWIWTRFEKNYYSSLNEPIVKIVLWNDRICHGEYRTIWHYQRVFFSKRYTWEKEKKDPFLSSTKWPSQIQLFFQS